ALLLVYGIAFGHAALGGGLLVYDDHPGQLYRLHHALAFGPAPWRFDPGWWAGYAELQFYPPGLAWLGWLLHQISWGALGAEAAYEVLLWLAWLLPGLTTFALLSRLLGNGWLALPGAFVAMTLSAGSRSGVEEGLRWGLVAARLGWSLLPLLGLSLIRWVDGRSRFPLLAPPRRPPTGHSRGLARPLQTRARFSPAGFSRGRRRWWRWWLSTRSSRRPSAFSGFPPIGSWTDFSWRCSWARLSPCRR